jgi:hypothetical protein
MVPRVIPVQTAALVVLVVVLRPVLYQQTRLIRQQQMVLMAVAEGRVEQESLLMRMQVMVAMVVMVVMQMQQHKQP